MAWQGANGLGALGRALAPNHSQTNNLALADCRAYIPGIPCHKSLFINALQWAGTTSSLSPTGNSRAVSGKGRAQCDMIYSKSAIHWTFGPQNASRQCQPRNGRRHWRLAHWADGRWHGMIARYLLYTYRGNTRSSPHTSSHAWWVNKMSVGFGSSHQISQLQTIPSKLTDSSPLGSLPPPIE
jgi:hypothetical protein